jgi:hypothetical protein
MMPKENPNTLPDGPLSKLIVTLNNHRMLLIAGLAVFGIVVHLLLHFGWLSDADTCNWPLWLCSLVAEFRWCTS